MAIFIWIAIMSCAITAPALLANSRPESGDAEEIRIEGRPFIHDSLTYRRSARWPGRRVDIQLLDGAGYRGRLLYVTDDYLYVGPDVNAPGNAGAVDSFAWTFRYDQIGKVDVLGGASFGAGFGYTMAIACLAGLAIGITGEEDCGDYICVGPWGQALIFVAGVGLPVALIGGILGSAEGAKKTCHVNGFHERFRNKVPYWQQRARYVQKAPAEGP
jgi:hypothetical protein